MKNLQIFLFFSLFFAGFAQQVGVEGEVEIVVPIVPGIRPVAAVNTTIDIPEGLVPIVPGIRPVAAVNVTPVEIPEDFVPIVPGIRPVAAVNING